MSRVPNPPANLAPPAPDAHAADSTGPTAHADDVDAPTVALVLLRDNGSPRSFALDEELTIIGRSEACNLRIPLGDVSRRHCSVMRAADGEGRLQDLGSSNGTYVNGRRVQESPLLAGDVIHIGKLKFLLQVDGQPAEPGVVPSRRAVAGSDEPGQASALNPTSQVDAADYGLDPSDAATEFEGLMDD